MSKSKTFIGGAVCREFESEAPAAEVMLDRVVCSSEQFSFQTCLECGDGSGTFLVDEDREFQTVGAVILKALEIETNHLLTPSAYTVSPNEHNLFYNHVQKIAKIPISI